MEANLQNLKEGFSEVRNDISKLNDKVDSLQGEVQDLKIDYTKLATKIATWSVVGTFVANILAQIALVALR